MGKRPEHRELVDTMRSTLAGLLALCLMAGCSEAIEPFSDSEPTPGASSASHSYPALDDLGPGWETIAPQHLMIIQTRKGIIAIALNSDFAPTTVQRMKEMMAARAFNGSRFYRVIDGFVAQGGLGDAADESLWPPITNENERKIKTESGFRPLGNADLFAPRVGHIDGFQVAQNPATGKEWLLHCPGAIAVARDNDPDSGSTEFYITLDAQRYLDRNLTVFGRVVWGMPVAQALTRTESQSVFKDPADANPGDEIVSIRIASDIPEAERPAFAQMTTNGSAFGRMITGKRKRTDAFFYNTPPEVVDICDAKTPSQRISASDQ